MEPYVNDGSNGFSPYSQNEFNIQPQTCLDDVNAPNPSPVVTPAPVTPVAPAPV